MVVLCWFLGRVVVSRRFYGGWISVLPWFHGFGGGFMVGLEVLCWFYGCFYRGFIVVSWFRGGLKVVLWWLDVGSVVVLRWFQDGFIVVSWFCGGFAMV